MNEQKKHLVFQHFSSTSNLAWGELIIIRRDFAIFFMYFSEDMYAQDSIDMLTGAGIQFKRHEEEGVEVDMFAELLISSGLVLFEEVTWITFAR